MDRLVQIRDFVSVGLKSTSHDVAHCAIKFRSEFRQTAAVIEFSTTIKRRVSSAKSLMFAPMSFTISLMYSGNSNISCTLYHIVYLDVISVALLRTFYHIVHLDV